MPISGSDDFAQLFQRQRRALEVRRVLRGTLTGLGLGLGFGAFCSALAYVAGWPGLRLPVGIGIGAAGALFGLLRAFRGAFSVQDAALFFDAKLKTKNEISAAVSPLLQGQVATDLEALLQVQAHKLLMTRDNQHLPSIWQRHHLLGLLAVPLLSLVCAWPEPVPASPERATETQTIRTGRVVDVAAFEQLQQLRDLTPSQAQRLKRLAEAAKRLQQRLDQGLARKEALSEVAKLQDRVQAELFELGSSENRAGLAAAASALRREPLTATAGRLLENGDLQNLDHEMKRLAAQAEARARTAAKRALEKAEQAARANGSEAVSSELVEHLNQFDARSRGAGLLRELTSSLDSQPKPLPRGRAQDTGSPENSGTEEGLKRLSRAQRQALAEQLLRALESGDFDFESEAEDPMEKLLGPIENQPPQDQSGQDLTALKRPGRGAARQRALTRALEGLRQTQRDLGGATKRQRLSSGKNGRAAAPNPEAAPGTPSPGRGGRRGKHAGATKVTDQPGFAQRTKTSLDLSLPLADGQRGRAAGRPGAAAQRPLRGPLPETRPSELQGVERAPIPAEYREQVSRYFSPE